jgi:subtilisin family serine protease
MTFYSIYERKINSRMISHKSLCLSLIISLLSLTLLCTQSFSQDTASTNNSLKTFSSHRYPVQVTGTAVSPAHPLGTTQGKPMYPPGEIVVRYFDNASPNDKARVRSLHNYTIKHKHKYLNAETLKVPATMSLDSYTSAQAMGALCSELRKDPAVKYAEPNYYVYAQEGFYGPDEIGYYPNDPFFSSDTVFYASGPTFGLETLPPGGAELVWSVNTSIDNVSTLYNAYTYTQQFNYFLENFVVKPPPQYQDLFAEGGYITIISNGNAPGTNAIEFTIAPGGWDYQQGNSSVKVAVIDTGVMYEHEDLIGKILAGYDYVNDSGSAVGGIAEDDNGHGTHVAGLVAAATNNYKGTAGSAPNIMIIPIKVLDAGGSGTDDEVSEGIIGAVEQFNANILNMSFGEATNSQLLEEAIYQVIGDGAIPIAAAGNNGTNFSTETECGQQVFETFEPALIPGVISVGSWEYEYSGTGSSDTVPISVGYSNYGFVTSSPVSCYTNWGVDVFAEGGGPLTLVWSTYLYPFTGLVSETVKYQPLMGTSMASPQVAGLAALLYSKGIQDLNAITAAIESSCWDPLAIGQPANTYATYTVSFGSYTNAIYTQPARNSHPEPNWGYGAIDALAALAGYQPSVNVSYISNSILDCDSTAVISGNTTILYVPDGYSGNCNGVLDPGETDGMNITIQNSGQQTLSNIVGVLSSSDSHVHIISNTQNYPNLVTGNQGTSLAPYVVQVSNFNIGNGYTIRFMLAVTATSINGTTTFNLPFDIALSQTNRYTSTGGVYHAIDLDPSLYATFVDDSNAVDNANSLIPGRADDDEFGNAKVAPTGNNQDFYLNNGESVQIYPNIVNNTPTTFYGIGTAQTNWEGITTFSGVWGELNSYLQTNNTYPITVISSENEALYYSNTAYNNYCYSYDSIPGQLYTYLVGYVTTSQASTEFQYNFSAGGYAANVDADGSFGNTILEFDLHTPNDSTANWIDRIPVSYAVITSVSFDHYVIYGTTSDDSLVEPGATIELPAYIRNNSPLSIVTANGPVFATLATNDPNIIISVPAVSYSTFANPKQMAGPDQSGFEFTVRPNTPQNDVILFNLAINAELLDTTTTDYYYNFPQLVWNCPFYVEMGELVLYQGSNSAYAINYNDSPTLDNLSTGAYNNGDGTVNPGEAISLNLSLWNRHYDQAINGVSAVLTTLASFVSIQTSAVFVGDIGARQIVTLPSPFQFIVNDTCFPPGSASTTINWELILTDSNGKQYINTFNTQVVTSYPPQVPGFPYNTGAPIISSPTLVDLDNIGVTDVLVGNEAGVISAISVTSSGSAIVPGWPIQVLDNGAAFPIRYPIAVGSIDTSSTNSVVVVPQDGKLYVFHNDGTPYLSSSTTSAGVGLFVDLTSDSVLFTTSPVLADLAGDGNAEIIVGATVNIGTTTQGAIYVFDHNGNLYWGVPLAEPVITPPAVGFISSNVTNTPQVVACSLGGEIAIYDSNGTRLQYFYNLYGIPINSPPALADIEQTGTPDIIINASDGNVYAFRPYDGSTVSGFPIYTGGAVPSSPAIGDVLGDGNSAIVVGGTDRMNIIEFSAASQSASIVDYSYFVAPDANAYIPTQPMIANFYHSTVSQVAMTDNYGSMHLLDFSLSTQVYVTPQLQYMDSSPGVLNFTNENATTNGGDDVNNATIVTSEDGNIYAYLEPYRSDPNLAYWPEYRHDAQHTGLYPLCYSYLTSGCSTYLNAVHWTVDNTPYKGVFNFLGDYDWLSFTGIANHIYRITVTVPNGSKASPLITLYDTSGTHVISGPTAPKIEQTVSSSGLYYIKVTNGNNNFGSSATYQVSIFDVTANTYIPQEMWKGFTE